MPDENKVNPTPPEGAQPSSKLAAEQKATSPDPPRVATEAKPVTPVAPKPAVATTAPKPAVPAKPAGPVPVPWDNEFLRGIRKVYGSGIREAFTYLGQNYVTVDCSIASEILQAYRDDEGFDYLVDLTAVHYPKREGTHFDVVYILYSFAKNTRVRVKTQIADGATLPSVVNIWPTANWLEREVFDMFGIRFDGHPDMKRILLPDDWKGYPLRKEYGILQQDTEWVNLNLGIESAQ
jgi:NADH-quinone oxidoreductase subunit C